MSYQAAQLRAEAALALRPVKHLCVDLDGTLLHNRAIPLQFDFIRSVLAALKLAGKGSALKNIRALMEVNRSLKSPTIEERNAGLLTNDQRTLEIVAKHFSMNIEEARTFVRGTLLDVFPKLEKHFYPRKGAHAFLEWARVRYPMTLATNPVWPEPIIEMRVKWAGIDPKWFTWMTTVNEMKAPKPHAEYYQGILERVGLKPEECLMIGDTPSMDLPAALIGMPVFILREREGLQPLKLRNATAPAWKGTYADLRKLLEASLAG